MNVIDCDTSHSGPILASLNALKSTQTTTTTGSTQGSQP